MAAKKRKSTLPCVGCHNNFYNGNNELGVKTCWSLEKAKLVFKQFIHVDQRPPHDHNPVVRTYNCHQKQRYVSSTFTAAEKNRLAARLKRQAKVAAKNNTL